MLTRKKKDRVLRDLADLTAIIADYIPPGEDATECCRLIAGVALDIGGTKFADALVESATESRKNRTSADISTPKVKGGTEDGTEQD